MRVIEVTDNYIEVNYYEEYSKISTEWLKNELNYNDVREIALWLNQMWTDEFFMLLSNAHNQNAVIDTIVISNLI